MPSNRFRAGIIVFSATAFEPEDLNPQLSQKELKDVFDVLGGHVRRQNPTCVPFLARGSADTGVSPHAGDPDSSPIIGESDGVK